MKDKKSYKVGNINIDREIDQLAKAYSLPQTRAYIHDLFTTVIKLHLDGADERDLYLVTNTLKELRHIFRVFTKYRDKRKVVMFGSHRSPQNSLEYKMAEEFASEMVKHDYLVITGGGGGVMEAGNKGAGKKGFAVKIKLPLEKEANPYVARGEKLINVKYFYTRKLAFIKESDATVLFPGGFGTHDEGFEVLTLMQTGKCTPRPVVMVEAPGMSYWKNWLRFVKNELLPGGFITQTDLGLFKIVGSVQAAVKEIKDFYRVYHSIRYGRGLTVIRLNQKVAAADLARLSQKYADIMSGEIKPCGPIPAEVRAKELLEKPRICFKFDRQSYNRLVGLVRDLNLCA
ncbi:MAG: TIGR00730 family Rossman fold protein [Candidatus Margulisbacteria bacterium]|nr:TIGR00730 family Rossman fold protein [Candidatus Margulisiibacteriota bacterium]